MTNPFNLSHSTMSFPNALIGNLKPNARVLLAVRRILGNLVEIIIGPQKVNFRQAVVFSFV